MTEKDIEELKTENVQLKSELEWYKSKLHVIDDSCCKMRNCNKCDAYRKQCENLIAELRQVKIHRNKKLNSIYGLLSNICESTAEKPFDIELMTGNKQKGTGD